TADGALVRASAEDHADLFWGLRGGGGNFGVVTSFEYRLHAVGPTILAGVILHPAARAREVLALYRDFIAGAPEYLRPLSDALIDPLAARAWRVATPASYAAVFHRGGAVGREAPDGSAFEARRATHAMTIDGVWSEPATSGACIAWVRDFWEAVRPHSTG